MNNKTYHGYNVSSVEGQLDLAYGGRVDPNKKLKPRGAPLATLSDIELFNSVGIAGLERAQFYGVIDRLKNSGLLE